jgi:heme O synthase-like polyprenyltransferase
MTKMEILAALVISASIGVAVGFEVHKILVAVAVGCALAVFSVLIMDRLVDADELMPKRKRPASRSEVWQIEWHLSGVPDNRPQVLSNQSS